MLIVREVPTSDKVDVGISERLQDAFHPPRREDHVIIQINDNILAARFQGFMPSGHKTRYASVKDRNFLQSGFYARRPRNARRHPRPRAVSNARGYLPDTRFGGAELPG